MLELKSLTCAREKHRDTSRHSPILFVGKHASRAMHIRAKPAYYGQEVPVDCHASRRAAAIL